MQCFTRFNSKLTNLRGAQMRLIKREGGGVAYGVFCIVLTKHERAFADQLFIILSPPSQFARIPQNGLLFTESPSRTRISFLSLYQLVLFCFCLILKGHITQIQTGS